MNTILSGAIIAIIMASLALAVVFRNEVCRGEQASSLFVFIAILFTSGLDVGLIMFPLTEFPVFEKESVYAFSNPLAIEFGFWGFLVWINYFLTTFYFCLVEPKLRLFERPTIKLINNLVIICTCAFTGFLFLSYSPDYIEGISETARYALLGFIVLLAVLSSTDIRFVKVLSVSSSLVFLALIVAMGLAAQPSAAEIVVLAKLNTDYFFNIHHFATPISAVHAFYLFWWLAWSIMIGQFVARFTGGIKAWKLLIALLVLPSVPIALWFSVLYYYHVNDVKISGFFNAAMILVGIVFVINSIDSLMRLYTGNLNITPERLGTARYVALNWSMMIAIILLYNFTPLKMEWVGLVVIGIYLLISYWVFRQRESLYRASSA